MCSACRIPVVRSSRVRPSTWNSPGGGWPEHLEFLHVWYHRPIGKVDLLVHRKVKSHESWANCMSWMGVKKGEASMKLLFLIYLNSMLFFGFWYEGSPVVWWVAWFIYATRHATSSGSQSPVSRAQRGLNHRGNQRGAVLVGWSGPETFAGFQWLLETHLEIWSANMFLKFWFVLEGFCNPISENFCENSYLNWFVFSAYMNNVTMVFFAVSGSFWFI